MRDDNATLELLAGQFLDGTLSRAEVAAAVRAIDPPRRTLHNDLYGALETIDHRIKGEHWVEFEDIAHALRLVQDPRDQPLAEGWCATNLPAGVCSWVGSVECTTAALTQHLETPSLVTIVDGLGGARYVQLRSPEGVFYFLQEMLQSPGAPCVDLLAEDEDVDGVLALFDLLHLDKSDIIDLPDFLLAHDWPQVRLCREDDNGNAFVISHHTSPRKASTLEAMFEARGHKQGYWVEAAR